MSTLLWIILAIVLVGAIWYLLSKKKKGPAFPQKPAEGPPTPPPAA